MDKEFLMIILGGGNNMSFILKHGNTYKITICENCEAEIGYTNKDITHLDVMDIRWERTRIDVICCPECNKYTEVNIISNMLARGLTPTKEELEKFKDK